MVMMYEGVFNVTILLKGLLIFCFFDNNDTGLGKKGKQVYTWYLQQNLQNK